MTRRADRGTEETTVPLRVATWNMNHWQQPMLPVNTRRAAWDYLASAGIDVVLAQEAAPTKAAGGAGLVHDGSGWSLAPREGIRPFASDDPDDDSASVSTTYLPAGDLRLELDGTPGPLDEGERTVGEGCFNVFRAHFGIATDERNQRA